jgi:hypothetical protein
VNQSLWELQCSHNDHQTGVPGGGGRKGTFTGGAYHLGMWQILTPARPRNDVLTLQEDAERAGLAWACPFSSSDEFEAAVISSRRRAGAYGPSRVRRYAFYVAAAAMVAMAGTYLLT